MFGLFICTSSMKKNLYNTNLSVWDTMFIYNRDLELIQEVCTGLGASGNVTNSVRWTLSQATPGQPSDEQSETTTTTISAITPVIDGSNNNVVKYSGRLDVQSEYNVSSKGDLFQSLTGHLLVPDEDSEVPDDIEGLVIAMQRSMPIDLFDPSDLFVHHTVSINNKNNGDNI